MEINNDELIHKLLNNYKKRIVNDRIKYHTKNKLNPEFMESNRQRAKDHYEKNKEKKKQQYQNNKEIHKSKNLYAYYKRNNKLDIFKDKHKEKYDSLVEIGFINKSLTFGINLKPYDTVELSENI